MYGLIHVAVREMVKREAGPEAWHGVAASAGIGQAELLTMRSYSDDITCRIIETTASVLEVNGDDLLQKLGRFWVLEFAPRDYGQLLDHAGDGFFRFLENLNDLHDRIATAFVDFRPPRFEVELRERETLIYYASERSGLTPFVMGLLTGVAERFDSHVEISIMREEHGNSVFCVREISND